MRIFKYRGIKNFRDFGAYPTRDGRSIIEGTLYRSGEWNHASEEDLVDLLKLNIRTICDLRSLDEASKGSHLDLFTDVEYVHLDTQKTFKDELPSWFQKLKDSSNHSELADVLMQKIYVSTAIKGACLYAEIFKRLLSKEVPLLIHCQAGKDRTGIGAALVLLVLGVEESVVMQDYLLSAELFKASEEELDLLAQRFSIPRETMKYMLTAKESWLKAAFEAIHVEFGSWNSYFTEGLLLSQEDILYLKELYTK